MLDITAANIKQAQKVQARVYNAKHARNAFAVGEKVMRMNHCGVQSSKCSEKGLNGLVLMKLWKGKVVAMATMC